MLHSGIDSKVVHVRLPGDGSINVRDDYLVVPAPQVDCAVAAAGTLILGGDAEHNVVRTLLQLQSHLSTNPPNQSTIVQQRFSLETTPKNLPGGVTTHQFV